MRKIFLISFLSFGLFSFAQENINQFTLEEAINYTLENNFNVKKASIDVEVAKQKVRETTAIGLPQIAANINYDYYINQPVSILPDFISPAVIGINEKLGLLTATEAQQARQSLTNKPQEVVFGQTNSFSSSLQWEQLLFSGSYLVGLQSAKAYKEISILGKLKTEAELKEATINAYTAVLVAIENEKITQKNVDVSERNLYEIEETYKAGFAEKQSVDQMRYMQKTLQNSLKMAQNQRQIAENTLKFIMGVDQETKIVLTSTVEDLMSEKMLVPSQIKTEELENHIDFKLVENKLKTSALQVKYQKSMALPTLSAFLSHSYNESGNDFLFSTDEKSNFHTTLLGVRLNIPIFSSFARSARTQQAALEYEKAKLERENMQQDLVQKAENARLKYMNAIDAHQTTKELVELSQSIYDKEKIKFKEGISTSTELATAERQLYDSENQYLQSILQVVSAKTSLNQALGNY